MVSVYNLKVFAFPNGDLQVRHYSQPIKSKQPEDPYEDSDLIFNPFDWSEVKEVEDFDSSGDNKVLTPEEVEANRWRNANRSKQAVFMYARCVCWEWFVTITFSDKKVNRYDFDECSKKIRAWLNNQRRNSPDLQYLIVPEQHKDGAWHFHGVLARTGNMKFIDSGKRDKDGSVIYNMIKWQNGFTTATKVKDPHRVAKYIGKYITKTVCDLTPGRQRYYVSRKNMPLPKVSTFLCTDEYTVLDALKDIAEKSNKKLAHVSTTQAKDTYTQVCYYEFV